MSAGKINNIAPRALGASVSGGTKMASIGAMGDLLKQAQEMQSRMAKIQEELANKTVQGSSGGGMVQVTVNGQLNITAVQIEPSVINSSEKEMLEDLILAAVNDGMRKARELASTEMSKLTGGLKIPGLMP
jgi:DNA-binding YbaB/EbfC family protein